MIRKERDAQLYVWTPELTGPYIDRRNLEMAAFIRDGIQTLGAECLRLRKKRADVEKVKNDVIKEDNPSHAELSQRFDPHFERIDEDLNNHETLIEQGESLLQAWGAGGPELRYLFLELEILDPDENPYLLPHAKVELGDDVIFRVPYSDWTQLTEDGTPPFKLGMHRHRDWWYFEDEFFSSSETLAAEEVLVLIQEQAVKRQRRIDRARTIASVEAQADLPKERSALPREVCLEVWQRDRGQCVYCESREKLEFDHIIPVSMGGADTVRNIQLLCSSCNKEKGASI